MNRAKFSASGALAVSLMMPLCGAAQTSEVAPAIAVSMGATFHSGTLAGSTFGAGAGFDLGAQTGLASLALASASGAHAAVANATAVTNRANTDPSPESNANYGNGFGGATANSGATTSLTGLVSTVHPSGSESHGFESEVLVGEQHFFRK